MHSVNGSLYRPQTEGRRRGRRSEPLPVAPTEKQPVPAARNDATNSHALSFESKALQNHSKRRPIDVSGMPRSPAPRDTPHPRNPSQDRPKDGPRGTTERPQNDQKTAGKGTIPVTPPETGHPSLQGCPMHRGYKRQMSDTTSHQRASRDTGEPTPRTPFRTDTAPIERSSFRGPRARARTRIRPASQRGRRRRGQ